MNKKSYTRLGVYFKTQRNKKGLSQATVAKKLGYSTPQYISNFERGTCAPAMGKMVKIARLYGIDKNDLRKVLVNDHATYIDRVLGIT